MKNKSLFKHTNTISLTANKQYSFIMKDKDKDYLLFSIIFMNRE